MPLLKAIAGPDGEDTLTLPYELKDPHSVDISKVSVLYCPDAGGNMLVSKRCPELLAAQHKVVAALIARGCQVRTVVIPEMHEAFEIWSAMMAAANTTKFRLLTSVGKEQIWVGLELAKAVFGCSDHTFPALGLAGLERVPELMPSRARYMRQLGAKLQERLHELLGENGVMLYPTLPQPAPKHNDLIFRFLDASFTSIFNVMELPVTAVPLGLNKDGLPLGIQVVANRLQDHLGIAFALALEQTFQGWQFPIK
jgi:fatty acid amide hydrolase 2